MFQVKPLHMKTQTLFTSKDKSKKLKCRLLQFLSGTFRVKAATFMNKILKMFKNLNLKF